jgi:hypothetical protein
MGVGAPPRPSGAEPGEEGQSDARFPDPITGEETANDWQVRFTFKARIGEPPPKEEGEEDQTPATPDGR